MGFMQDRDETIAQNINVLTAGFLSTGAFMECTGDRFISRMRIVVPVGGHCLETKGLRSGKSPAVVIQLRSAAQGAVDVEDYKHGKNNLNKTY